MNVLIASNFNGFNHYVEIIRAGLIALGCKVTVSVENFWKENKEYDIVHIMWPEELFKWKLYHDFDNEISQIDEISRQLDFFKDNGTKIVFTLHNEKPHGFVNDRSGVYDKILSKTNGLYSESFKDIGKLLKQINIDLSNTTSGLLKENKKTITLNMVYGFLDFIKHNRNKAFKNNIKMDYAAAWFYYIKYFALDYGFVCFPFENKTFKVKFKRLQKLMNRIKTKISNSSI
jgi:hypothetical protein